MSLEHCGGCLFWPSLLLLALNLTRNEAWVVPETSLFDGVLGCFQLSRSLVLLIFNFFDPLLF